MSTLKTDFGMKQSLIYRQFWLSALLIGVLLFLAAGLLVGTSWRSLNRLAPIHRHMVHLDQLEKIDLQLQNMVLASLNGEVGPDARTILGLRAEVRTLVSEDGYLGADTYQRLEKVNRLLDNLRGDPTDALIAAQQEWTQMISAETEAHDALLQTMDHDTRTELQFSIAIVVALPVLALLLFLFLRKRILLPLNNLGYLMSLLAQQDYRSVLAADVDPLLRPLFNNYNHMVNRLEELEQEHQARRRHLEQEVRAATQTLLEQQRTLARTERLAAVGEVAAGLAHELRNPLAGIQLALSNLRREVEDVEQTQRLDLMITELKRVTRLLNDLLGQARQSAEPETELVLGDVVTDLLALVRYQVPETIVLHQAIPAGLRCRLPEGHLRQALLNLLLNAAQACVGQTGEVRIGAVLEGGRLELTVCDDGPGFPPDLIASGVRAFATWREDGTGLGLAMVRRFTRDLGGDMHLANRTPRGACVTLDLPCKGNHA